MVLINSDTYFTRVTPLLKYGYLFDSKKIKIIISYNNIKIFSS